MLSWSRMVGAVVLAGALAPAQPPRTPDVPVDPAYDGRVTFVRLRWRADRASGRRGGFATAWDHDYPRAERHLSQIIRELTLIDVRVDTSRILTLDDPDLSRYPIAYMWEPGFWTLTDGEAAAFRAYLLKGGFAVFEDFDREQWRNFERQMARVLPDLRWVKLDGSHAVFNGFFRINRIEAIVHPMFGYAPSYFGLFENNDPAKRLIAIANYDNDVPEYWEWSGEGLYPFNQSNEAYKLGVNYFVYGLTH